MKEEISKTNFEIDKKLKFLESKIIEQEHRPTHLVLNYFRRKNKWPEDSDIRQKAATKAIIWRLFFSPTTLAVASGGLMAFITIVFLIKQNSLLEIQNSRIQEQVYLEEASRRNNLVLLMDNVLDKVNEELNKADNTKKSLSRPLAARILALGQGFQPYKFYDYEADSLTKPLSPERGQLLIALMASGIDSSTINIIKYHSNFNNIYLKYSSLSDQDLSDIRMFESHFNSVDFSDSKLESAFMPDCFIFDSNFTYSNLQNVDFTGSKIRESNFCYANLQNASLIGCDLRNSIFVNTDLRGVQLGSIISVDYYDEVIEKIYDRLYEVKKNVTTSFKGAFFHEAKVNKDWFDLIRKQKVIGYEEMINKYELKGPFMDKEKTEFYKLEMKKEYYSKLDYDKDLLCNF